MQFTILLTKEQHVSLEASKEASQCDCEKIMVGEKRMYILTSVVEMDF
jgi:hypothetical protein